MLRSITDRPVPMAVDDDLVAHATHSHLPLRTLQLTRVLAAVVRPNMAYAVGGGVGLGAAGLARTICDFTVFARPVAARRISHGLRTAGLTITDVSDVHVRAHVAADNMESLDRRGTLDYKIDLIVTTKGPEMMALRTALLGEIAGKALKVVRPDVIAGMKFISGRAQDLADVASIVEIGIVDLGMVKTTIAAMADDAAAERFSAWLQELRKPRPKGRFLSRAELQETFAALHSEPGRSGRLST